jgi:hypothetical protein
MEKRDAFAFGAEPGLVIDQSQACTTTPFQCSVQIIDSEADVVNAGTAFGDELADGRLGGFGLQQLHERLARAQTGDPGTIGIVQGLFGDTEQVAIKGQDLIEGFDGNSDVRDSGAFGHWHQSIEGTSTIEDVRHG